MRELATALWLPTALLVGMTALVTPPILEAQLRILDLGTNPPPAAVAAAMQPVWKWLGLNIVGSMIVIPMTATAALRKLLTGQKLSRPFFLAFGADEVRLLLTFLLAFAAVLAIYVVLFLGGLVIGVFAQSVIGPLAQILALLLLLPLFWFMARLSLMTPAAIDRRQNGVPVSFRLTKGKTLGLAGYWSLIGLAMLAPTFVFYAIAMPGVFEAASGGGSGPDADRRALEMQRDFWDLSKPGAPLRIAGAYALSLVTAAVANVAAGAAYLAVSENRNPA